jgi:predicted aminopeptidase
MHRYIKRGLLILLALFIGVCLYFGEEILYGISQGYGQLRIVWNARPVTEVLEDNTFPDSLKPKIKLVQEIRQFAFDSLGLDYNENYTSIYDQHGKPILWVVTGSEPYQLKAKEWTFPFLGTFTYKGFFKYEKAVKAEEELGREGWDTEVDEVSGWSTLGWFKDPILSNMLRRAPGSLSNLIIHELTHGTLYVKNNVQFNENLASFVGDKGALKFLSFKYGVDSKEYKEYIQGRTFNKEFSRRVLIFADRLDSLYTKIRNDAPEIRKQLKQAYLRGITQDLLAYIESQGYKKDSKLGKELQQLNNTFFIDYRRYREDLDQFENEFLIKFNGDIKKYLKHLKEVYPSL